MNASDIAFLIVLSTVCFAFLMWLCAVLFTREERDRESEYVDIDDSEGRKRDVIIEAIARQIYERELSIDDHGRHWPWVEGGNSHKQDEARHRAKKQLDDASNPL